jgi:hypothetical protein
MLHPFVDPTFTPKYAETGPHIGAIVSGKSKIDQAARDMTTLRKLPILEKALRVSFSMLFFCRIYQLIRYRRIRSSASA